MKNNFIQTVNSDPMLSQFKYHFILKRFHLPRKVQLSDLACIIHQGFKIASLTANSIYIIQITHTYQEEEAVDLAVGFRRDEMALKIAREKTRFDLFGRSSIIELSEGFKIFLDELRNECCGEKEEGEIVRRDENMEEKEEDEEKSNKSRSREKKKRKNLIQRLTETERKDEVKNDKYKLFLLMIPLEATRHQILDVIEKKIINAKDIISYEWKKENQIAYLEVVINRKTSFEKIIQTPFQLLFYHVLVLPSIQNLSAQILARQAIYTKRNSPSILHQLVIHIQSLNWFRENGVVMINVSECGHNQILVTFSHEYKEGRELQIEGWDVKRNEEIRRFNERPSLCQHWYKYKKGNR